MKIAIFILCHHKPWLIRSSLLSLLSQDNDHDYDLHFIIIVGNGEDKSNKKYKEYFKNKKKYGEKNTQLSKFDKNVINELKKLRINYQIHKFSNDHGLDSGAWIKLIRSNIWKKYDYSVLLMEGFLFTNNKVLSSLKKFIETNKPDFISSAHEKRFFKLNKKKQYKNNNYSYHTESTKKIWLELLKIKNFKNIYKHSKNYIIRDNKRIQNITEHHVSKYSLTLFQKIKLYIKSVLFLGHFYKQKSSILVTTKMKMFMDIRNISKKNIEVDGIHYHLENNPFFFGCSCQHIFSKKMMIETNNFFKKNKIYEIAKLPYFGEVFEIVWGALPIVLNKKKWYFNGIHRVRKNLIDYKREDNISGVIKYLNLYNQHKLEFYKKDNDIKYRIVDKKNSLISKLIK